MVQGDDEHLGSLLHQGLPVVGEQQVIVGNPIAHRVIGTHGVEEGGEKGQCVSARERRTGLQDITSGLFVIPRAMWEGQPSHLLIQPAQGQSVG
jgi:hypothetical protein